MTDHQIQIQERIKTYTNMGFYSQKELTDIILSIVEDYELTDKTTKKWIREIIKKEYENRLAQSITWTHPTDPEKLKIAFDELCSECKIISLHNQGYENSDAIAEVSSLWADFEEYEIEPKAVGYCYYHYQDLEIALNPESKTLLIGFDSLEEDENKRQIEQLKIGRQIAKKLVNNGLKIKWDETNNNKIEIINIDWLRIFNDDKEEWDSARVLDLIQED
ncbi:DUF6891 domain-containing protein [Flavobacterium facile]|uniref:DUF6891 domain-containing protein n=1 Tax=Flavobacterium facile TaxID=2893174 RepID=UPI002E78471C|nr:hypothetical protein [Flavobacterium sp. T-12]